LVAGNADSIYGEAMRTSEEKKWMPTLAAVIVGFMAALGFLVYVRVTETPHSDASIGLEYVFALAFAVFFSSLTWSIWTLSLVFSRHVPYAKAARIALGALAVGVLVVWATIGSVWYLDDHGNRDAYESTDAVRLRNLYERSVKDNDWYRLSGLARNPATPEDILILMSEDPNPSFALALNPQAPSVVLRNLARSCEREATEYCLRLLMKILEHPSMDRETLELLASEGVFPVEIVEQARARLKSLSAAD
jgi:hypothetical protein